MNSLRALIVKQVTRQGVLSFEKFMELALYCPKLGYYERSTASIGRAGDFITSASIGSVFGELLAFQFSDWMEAISRPVQLVEAGAHDGRLARDVLNHIRAFHPGLFERVELWLIEPSAMRREAQAATLAEFSPRVRWFTDWSELPDRVKGVIYSNELLDAFPVRRFAWDSPSQRWFEWGVALENEQFVWAKMPGGADDSETNRLLRECGFELTPELVRVLPDGFILECCPAAMAWWSTAARSLGRGKIVAIDYGWDALGFLRPERAQGTLRAYLRQHVAGDPLAQPGEQDLTAHVNFTAIRDAGERAGLITELLEPQEKFLTRVAERTWNLDNPFGKWTPARMRQFRTLMHPEHLGRPFRVLVQAR